MRDFASCFGYHAISVDESSCSCIGSSSAWAPATNTVSCFYRTTRSTQEMLIKVTWHRNNCDTPVSVALEDNPSSHLFEPNGINCQLLRTKKGSRSFVSGDSVFVLHWDISAAKYGAGAEPTKDFYLIMMADAELILLLGDMCREFIKKLQDKVPVAEFSMYSRKEQVYVTTLYSTKARFRDGAGKDHEVLIRCKGDECDAKDGELYICVDKKRLIHVKSIEWNFRGNQTIFFDGSAVDVLWDVHDWWFRGSSGCATFMFRTRSTPDSRLWLDEELAKGSSHFTLLIQAVRSQ